MKHKRILVFLVTVISLFCCNLVSAQVPELYIADASKAAAIKSAARTNKVIAENIRQLSRQADKVFAQQFGSVMDKKFSPPCGDMHEYMSMAKYFWPDTTKTDGKPYVRKDGQRNPDIDLVSDDKNFDDMISCVNTLGWAYYFTGEEKYAKKCISLVRFWFLDTATRMAPNLNHAQIRMGIDTGSNSGIIDTHTLPKILDVIGLLRSSKDWTTSDESGMKEWFTNYLEWMRTSRTGKKEAEAKNNHGTFYDLQIVAIASFCKKDSVASDMLKSAFSRIASQIQPDGKQPFELERTLALSYSLFNLEAWSLLANAAEKKGVDLWHYQAADGRSLQKAIDYLVPYIIDGKAWEYQQIKPYKPSDFYRLLLIASEKFGDKKYKIYADKIKDANKDIFVKIFFES